jgi:hypothetical protein
MIFYARAKARYQTQIIHHKPKLHYHLVQMQQKNFRVGIAPAI